METDSEKIQLEILLRAPIVEVWRAWTEPDRISKWFGSDPNGKGLKAMLNVCPGGFFEITFQDSNRTEHTCFGVYSVVREFSSLTFSWNWKSEPGVESFVTVELKSENNFTRMLFRHEHLGKGSQHNYEEGWKSTFLKLERSLS